MDTRRTSLDQYSVNLVINTSSEQRICMTATYYEALQAAQSYFRSLSKPYGVVSLCCPAKGSYDMYSIHDVVRMIAWCDEHNTGRGN